MSRQKAKRKLTLAEKYPPSRPCSCEVCVGYCARPGWWAVAEAERALEAGYAGRMMLEMAPDNSFGVLAPAFKGCEGTFALDRYADQGCNFLVEKRCELHATGFQPLECRHCHHDRPGSGLLCHADVERDWQTPAGQALVVRWSRLTGFGERIQRQYGARKMRSATRRG